jgi:hypothetical protein
MISSRSFVKTLDHLLEGSPRYRYAASPNLLSSPSNHPRDRKFQVAKLLIALSGSSLGKKLMLNLVGGLVVVVGLGLGSEVGKVEVEVS